MLKVKRLSEHACLPVRATSGSVGYDLVAAHPIVIPRHCNGLVQTDLAIIIPQGHYGRIAPRSGLALREKIDVGAGVIDTDYRGPVGVVLFNHSDNDFHIKRGDKIAQLILEKISILDVQESDWVINDEDLIGRGTSGFGSTDLLPPQSSETTVIPELVNQLYEKRDSHVWEGPWVRDDITSL